MPAAFIRVGQAGSYHVQMELSPIPRHEYERLMSALGLALDTPELQRDHLTVAAQAGGCYYVDPLVFRVVLGEEPLLISHLDACALAARPLPVRFPSRMHPGSRRP